jgi:hypothetical protein
MERTPSASSSKSPMYRITTHSKRYWHPMTEGGTVKLFCVLGDTTERCH